MISSILCYVPPSVELLGPTILQFTNLDQRHPQFSNQINTSDIIIGSFIIIITIIVIISIIIVIIIIILFVVVVIVV